MKLFLTDKDGVGIIFEKQERQLLEQVLEALKKEPRLLKLANTIEGKYLEWATEGQEVN